MSPANALGNGVSATAALPIPSATKIKNTAASEYTRHGFKKAKAPTSVAIITTNKTGHQLVKKSERKNIPLANPETIAISALMSVW